MHQVRQLWYHFLIRRRMQFVLLIILMFIASLAEIATIGAILPFLGVLAAPEQVFKYELMQPIIHLLQINNSDNLLLPLTVLFIFFALLAGSIRILLLHVMTRLSYAAGADLSINIYRRTLYQDYSVHVSRNSSEVINGIITKTNTVISNVISPILTFISSVIFIIFILTALFMIDVVVALTSSISLGLLYWLTISYTSQQLKNNSQCIADQSTQMVKSLQEGLGGIRDVLIDGTQQFYCQIYRNADLPLRRASGDNIFINGSPRYMMEAIGMTMIAGLAYMMSLREGGLANTIPILGALALGAQRLLPALQQAYESYSTIKGSKFSLIDVLKLLDQPLPNYADQPPSSPIPFENKISLKNINFRYTKETPWVLKNVSLDIYKGDKIGFIGATGSGKSTFLDIVMGLLTLKNGSFSIDGQIISDKNKRAWQAHISHVPQNIYLSDSSIEENIAFGIPKNKIDQQRVKIAAKQAQISEVIDEWENGYQTLVGEGGGRLSGGQRQRIGIARALYRQSNVLILDEATSALDDETESAVMKAIEKLNKRITILIIAHRLTTLKNCNKIVKLDKDGMAHVTSYDDIMNLGGK